MSRARNKAHDSGCPIASALNIFGDRWTLLILRDILFFDKKRYNELLDSFEGISTNILATRLKTLEEHGLITKELYTDRPPRYEYVATQTASELVPTLVDLMRWSLEHVNGSNHRPFMDDLFQEYPTSTAPAPELVGEPLQSAS